MSKRAKIILGIIIILLLGGGAFLVWNKWTGWLKIGADTIFGCQSPRAISSFLGSPGSNLVSYNLFGNEVSVNDKIISFLDNVQKEVNAANTGYQFANVQTYNYRPKRGGGGLSLHSWGMAIDINPQSNPYQIGKTGDPQTDIPPKVLEIFKNHGFQWGGDWVGERDPMHFEFYGGEVYGSFIDASNGQKITEVSATVSGRDGPNSNGDYRWVLETTHPHEVIAKAKGYEENKFILELTCFEDRNMDIALKPLPANTPGSVSGRVTLSGNRSMVIPATIYIDGKAVGATNILGEYIIDGVRRGKHKIEAKILFFPGASIDTPDMKPGENVKNLNFTIGR